MVRGHLVALAGLLVQPHPPAIALRVMITRIAKTAPTRATAQVTRPSAHEPGHVTLRAIGQGDIARYPHALSTSPPLR